MVKVPLDEVVSAQEISALMMVLDDVLKKLPADYDVGVDAMQRMFVEVGVICDLPGASGETLIRTMSKMLCIMIQLVAKKAGEDIKGDVPKKWLLDIVSEDWEASPGISTELFDFVEHVTRQAALGEKGDPW